MDRKPGASPPTHAGPRPWEWLYDVVGIGMWALSHTRFDVQILGGTVPAVTAGQLWVVTHRAETDVPLVGGILMRRGGMWRHRSARVHFAARDDLFQAGVVSAGLRLPAPLARAAWPISPGRWLPRVRAHPVRRPTGLKLSQALDGLAADLPLAEVVGPRVQDDLANAAAARGRRAPTTVGQSRDPAFAGTLWGDVTADDLDTELGRDAWRRHVAHAATDVRRIVELVRAREPVVLFPEGRVSPDGALGPVSEMLDLIVRRGGPASVVPVGIAYDPLRRGRQTAAVSVGPPVEVTSGPIGSQVRDKMRHAMPVTAGQVVARELMAASQAGDTVVTVRRLLEAMARTAEDARREGRPIVRVLTSPGRRVRALRGALEVAVTRGVAQLGPDGSVRLACEQVMLDPVIGRLATEDAAIWQAE